MTRQEILNNFPPPCLSGDFNPHDAWSIEEIIPYIQREIIKARIDELKYVDNILEGKYNKNGGE